MTEQKPARPATLRPVPQPAPDEEIDPVDPRPAPAKKAAPARGRKIASATKQDVLEYTPKQREIVVSLSTRVSLDVSMMLEAEVAKSGKSVRAAVEHALKLAYGQDGRKS